MDIPSQLEKVLRPGHEDRRGALAHVADLLGSQHPSCEATAEHKTGEYDIAAVIATMRGLFDEVNDVLRRDNRADQPENDDAEGTAAPHCSILEPALAVVAALPPFSAVIFPVVLSDIVGRTQTEPGHATSRGGDLLRQFDGLLDNVMHLIEQVTEAVCSTLSSYTDSGVSADLVMPLYRLITGWECAFRGKGDCLRIADSLFTVLLGQSHRCEDPTSVTGEKNGDDISPPLWLSDRLQQTLDVYHCIVATFEATQGPDFNEWVVTTPYWVTLLNIASGYTCAFTAEDVVSEQMPARHEVGLLMLERLANSPFADLAVTTSSALLISDHVWETADPERNELDLNNIARSLFFLDKEISMVRPNTRWSAVCPSAECGAMILTGWLGSARPSYFVAPANVNVILAHFERYMIFFALSSVKDRAAAADRLLAQRPGSDFTAQLSCSSLLPAESIALRLTALWAAAHFAGKEHSKTEPSDVDDTFLFFLAEKDLVVAADEPAAMVIAAIGVCLAAWDDGEYPSIHLGLGGLYLSANLAARVLKSITPILLEHHVVDPAASNACWRLCSAVLGHASITGSQVEAPDLLNIAQHALAELERGCASLHDVPTPAKVDCVRAPQPSNGPRPPAKYGMLGDRCRKRCLHKHFREPTRASVLSACVVKCVLRLAWTHGSFPADEARRIVLWLHKDLKRAHAVVVPLGESLARGEVFEADVGEYLTYGHTIEAAGNIVLPGLDAAGDDLFATTFDMTVELSKLPQHPEIVGPLVPLVHHAVFFIAIEDLDRSRRAAAFELSWRDEVLKRRGGELLATLVHRVCIEAGHLIPPIDSFLGTLGEMFESGRSVSDLRQAALLVSEAVHPGAASLSVIERVWAGIAAHVPNVGDEWCWGFFAGQLLRAVPRQQLLSASRTFMKHFLSVPLGFLYAETHEETLERIAPVCAFVQFADPSAIQERSSEITHALRHTLRVYYGGSLRLAQCVIDNAIEGRGMTVDLGVIDDVMWGCRRALNLPDHTHPCIRWKSPEHFVSDPQHQDGDETVEKEQNSNSSDSPGFHGSEVDAGGERHEEPDDNQESDDVDDDDWTPVVRQPLFNINDTPRCFDARRAIAALLAVAEWLHRNCATTVVVSTVQQGPVLERTVTASSDALRQLDPDAAAAAPTAAAMVVSSVAPWLPEMENSFSFGLDGPVASPSMLQEAQQMWDRIVRWAMDPSLNAALLATLPVPRDEIIQIAVRADLSPWASAAVQEVITSAQPSMNGTNRSKRPRSSRLSRR